MQLKNIINQEQEIQLEKLIFKLGNIYCRKHGEFLDYRIYKIKSCYNCPYLEYEKEIK